MSKMIHKKYASEVKLFSDVFLFCVRYHGKKVVVIDDETVAEDFSSFLALRGIVARFNDMNLQHGFCIIFAEALHKFITDCNALSYICINNKDLLSNDIPESIPVFMTTLDMTIDDNNYWKSKSLSATETSYPSVACFLMNQELKPIFLNTFIVADKEIDLICPWINRYVVNETFIDLVYRAVSRGVLVKIIYGIGSEGNDVRQKTSEKTVEMLKKRFLWTDLLRFQKGNTHIKYLICDEKYMMCGSYNLLSFTADYEQLGVRDEGMEYIVDENQIVQRRKQLFSWE